MIKQINKLFFLLILALCGCGTGPWYIQKKIYNTYKTPIYLNSDLKLRTDGFYVQLSDSSKVDYSKKALVFNDKGYIISLNINELQNLIKSQKSIEKELNWWRVKNDSIIIENYGETKRLIKTMVWWHKGKIINDSIIKIAYQDNNYKYGLLKYQFVESTKIPELKNIARYMKKEWYLSNLNESRK